MRHRSRTGLCLFQNGPTARTGGPLGRHATGSVRQYIAPTGMEDSCHERPTATQGVLNSTLNKRKNMWSSLYQYVRNRIHRPEPTVNLGPELNDFAPTADPILRIAHGRDWKTYPVRAIHLNPALPLGTLVRIIEHCHQTQLPVSGVCVSRLDLRLESARSIAESIAQVANGVGDIYIHVSTRQMDRQFLRRFTGNLLKYESLLDLRLQDHGCRNHRQ